jgi:hypothetical protein
VQSPIPGREAALLVMIRPLGTLQALSNGN